MRLLRFGSRDELQITRDLVHDIPPYAILSHTWGGDDDEVTFEDIRSQKGEDKTGYQKILFCGRQARHDGLEYFWVDTCCIDKTSSAELSKAINSMFQWYQNASKCYVYLGDVLRDDRVHADEAPRSTWKLAFRRSRWFLRGWTLQELIAPMSVEFFSSEGQRLGSKQSLEQEIHEITRIPVRALQGYSLSEFSVEERISWSNIRKTTQAEDKAYSLLGIVGVHMPLIYGEGEELAYKRLRREIRVYQDESINDPHLEASLNQCLADLRITDPRDDKSRIESTKGGLLKDSSRWIFEHEDFRQWRKGKDSRLLWIKGDPGKGKTMLLCDIANELSPLPANEGLVSYFFCQATDTNLDNATAVLRGLLYMLAKQDRLVLKHLHEEYKTAGKDLFHDANTWDALVRIFNAILQNHKPGGLVFIIDALDECSKDLPKLLRFVIQQSHTSQAKWLVASRNWPDIESQLKTADRKVQLSLELNQESLSSAVSIYIRHKVDELQHIKSFDDIKRDEIIRYLTLNANHTFLWVSLVCQQLADPRVRVRHLLKELSRFPVGLESLYKEMFKSINDNSLDTEDAEICHNILATVSVVYRPISLPELTTFIDSPESINDIDELRDVVQHCGSFLTIREDIIYFVHQSAKDFLVMKAADKIFPGGVELKHSFISSRSIKALSKTLRRDIYDLREPGISIDNIQIPSTDPLAQIRYCCIYWVDHLDDGSSSVSLKSGEDLRDCGAIQKFLEKHYLHWLESLSLLKEISKGVFSISKLLQLLEGRENVTQLSILVYDAMRFIQYHSVVITESPLQVYGSALIFSPNRSIIRGLFRQEEPEWIVRKPVVGNDWSSCLQTLEGHTNLVTSVAFSPDGRVVASSSDDNTVKLWATDTGALMKTLEGHTDSVCSVTFSPDGQVVASASYDNTVKLWAAGTGSLQQTLTGHIEGVISVAFSPNGQVVASASADETIRLWAADTGALQQTLKGHTNRVWSIRFSPDGRLVASASDDYTVKLWAADSGALQQTLEGHTGPTRSVVFSPDGRLMASASWDGTIKFWATNTGELQQTIEDTNSACCSLAFSPDGRVVASASDKNVIKLWAANTGALQQTLEGHTSRLTSVTVSPCGRFVASASADKTVKLWAVVAGGVQRTFEDYTGPVRSVALSPDGRVVASASWNAVKLWATDTGALRHTFEGQTDPVVFSSDGRILATALSNNTSRVLAGNTVKLWVVDTGVVHQALEGHTDVIKSVAFSPDGRVVATASIDKTVRLWDANTGALQETLEGHISSVWSVSFSPDCQLVVSASHDRTAKLWAADTGALQWTFEGCLATIYTTSVLFSPDGRVVALASNDNTVKLLATDTSALLQILKGHTGAVESVAFSPDGRLVASASIDQTIKLWAADTGALQKTIDFGPPPVTLSFNGNSQYVLTDAGVIAVYESQGSGQIGNRTNLSPPKNEISPKSIQGDRAGYGLSIDRTWITLHGRRILWLAPDFRPSCSCVFRSTVILGCGSGRFSIIKFAPA